MKRNNLTTAVIAGLAGAVGIASTAAADLYLNPDGTGQVLLYPYYTVNAGNQTLISVVNTTGEGKAVKVRFLEGRNSREVLDFNLYLSPFDVWTGAIFRPDGGEAARLVTGDTSCTVPQIPAGGVDFRNAQYGFTGAGATGANRDSGPATLDRTREGYVEMIEMAEIDDIERTSLSDITHTAAGVPANCARIRAAWVPPAGYWITSGGLFDTNPPAGGLFGNASIVDVAQGTMFSYGAEAIDGFRAADAEVLHTRPDSIEPNLTAALTNVADGTATAVIFSGGAALSATYPGIEPGSTRLDAVSALFTQSALVNEFALDEVLGAKTEWVINFPTKRFYVDQNIVGVTARRPFTRIFPTGSTTQPGAGRSCVDIGLEIFDREEGFPFFIGGIDFSPRPPEQVDVPQLCFETTIISFNQADGAAAGDPSDILGSILRSNIEAGDLNGSSYGYENGWLKIDFTADLNHRLYDSDAAGLNGSLRIAGLPATGFGAQVFINENAAPGSIANYAGAWRHRGERNITLAP